MGISAESPYIGVFTTHRSYEAAKSRWTKCRDIISGEDTVKERGTAYLPQPSGMSTTEYKSYLTRAAFAELTSRARDAMVGLVGKKRPVLSAPPALDKLCDDITYTGISLDDFAFQVLGEIMDVGRCGILVDYPNVEEQELAYSDVEDKGLRPYAILYKAEDILDWREGRKGNRKVLTYLKLKEVFDEPWDDDPNMTKMTYRIRIFNLDPVTGKCMFQTWTYNDDPPIIGETIPIGSPTEFIYQNGEEIDYIPFVFVGPLENTPMVQKPPLLGMANINIHHYQASADRNHALHYCDLPTPVIIGNLMGDDGTSSQTIRLGPTSAINLVSGQGVDAKFLEMTGNGINPTKELMEEYVSLMSVLGSKILALDSRAAEAAETASIHRAGEQAILASIANNVSRAITFVLKVIASYLNVPQTSIDYQLSTDYIPTAMSSQTLIALIGAVTAGKLSDQEFFEALVDGDMVRPDKTFAEHKAEIALTPKTVAQTPASGGTFGLADKGIADATHPNTTGSIALDGNVQKTMGQ